MVLATIIYSIALAKMYKIQCRMEEEECQVKGGKILAIINLKKK
jgi:hypothetical protein